MLSGLFEVAAVTVQRAKNEVACPFRATAASLARGRESELSRVFPCAPRAPDLEEGQQGEDKLPSRLPEFDSVGLVDQCKEVGSFCLKPVKWLARGQRCSARFGVHGCETHGPAA